LLGLAVGDAIGTTVEFTAPGSFTPMTDMVGGGPFHLEAGQWTDDTSMALCLATSLVETQRFDPHDQMERYVRWWREGYLSSNGVCFDIGNTVRGALDNFEKTGDPFSGSNDSWSAGNGSIMRLAPVPLFFFPDIKEGIRFSGESSRTTHGLEVCIDACRVLGAMIFAAITGKTKQGMLEAAQAVLGIHSDLLSIVEGGWRTKEPSEISGSGYVVQSLEAAVWSFWTTDTFETAILRAVNLGDDADTTAAVTGQLAGAFYGRSGIPIRWLECLHAEGMITSLAGRLITFENNSP
jgi:ADP-ribosyl-[dinitrogen reductase] hydrolase